MKTNQRLTGFVIPATRCGARSGMESLKTGRFLDRCERALDQVFYIAVWVAVVCTVMLVAKQTLMYGERKAYERRYQNLTYRVISTSPAHGGDAWQTRK